MKNKNAIWIPCLVLFTACASMEQGGMVKAKRGGWNQEMGAAPCEQLTQMITKLQYAGSSPTHRSKLAATYARRASCHEGQNDLSAAIQDSQAALDAYNELCQTCTGDPSQCAAGTDDCQSATSQSAALQNLKVKAGIISQPAGTQAPRMQKTLQDIMKELEKEE